MVVEEGYFDRHYMDEHVTYYSTCRSAPGNFCTRLHFFAHSFDDATLQDLLGGCGDSDPRLSVIQEKYLGFACIRPVREAPVGRTVLRPFPESTSNPNQGRVVLAVSEVHVHLGSLPLKVTGLPFQQQDQRVGACATTATWSALARVSRADGDRPPTPSEVTDAAVQFAVPGGRPYPSAGLAIEQICQAIHTLGKAPDLISATKQQMLSQLMLRAFLRSGIPPILVLMPLKRLRSGLVQESDRDGHAVTCAGYRHDASLSDQLPPYAFRLPGLQYDQVYVHDDNTGPYAKASLTFEPILDSSSLTTVVPVAKFQAHVLTLEGQPWHLSNLIAPLYPKIRSSVVELFEVGSAWLEAVCRQFQVAATSRFGLDARLAKGGDYLADLRRYGGVAPSIADRSRLIRSVSLSRYIGVVEITLDGAPFIDMLFDTTDRLRFDASDLDSLCGAVVYQPQVFGIADWMRSMGINVA
jgi:hypothetical protein